MSHNKRTKSYRTSSRSPDRFPRNTVDNNRDSCSRGSNFDQNKFRINVRNIKVNKFSLVFFFLFFSSFVCFSQEIVYYPINFVAVDLLESDDLSKYIDKRLCEINDVFIDAGVHFTRRRVHPISSEEFCPNCYQYSVSEIQQVTNQYYARFPNETDYLTIWLFKQKFITQGCDQPSTTFPGFANFPESYYGNGVLGIDDDGIYTNKFNNIWFHLKGFFKGSTLIHEMGHFFGLYHIHHNFDSNFCYQNSPSICDYSCDELICNFMADDNNGDQLSKTIRSPNFARLLRPYNNLELESCEVLDEILKVIDDKKTLYNYMSYNGSREHFTSDQLDLIKNISRNGRSNLQHAPENLSNIQEGYNPLRASFYFKWEYTNGSSCLVNKSRSLNASKKAQNSLFRIQITKDQNKSFKIKSGYKENWNDPVNSTLVADIGIFEQNGVISFDWSDAAVDGTSVFEGPKIGETYKATLARPYLDQQGFSIFSEEIIFTIQEDYPSLNASGLFANNTTQTTTTLNWSRGDGEKCIVIATSCGSVSTVPVDGTDYSANSNYSSASSLGNSKIVYEGSGTTVNITGLAKNSCYQFEVFEFNGTGNETKYLHSYAPKVEERTDGDFSVDFYWDPDPIVAGEYIDFDWYSSKGGLVTNNWTFQGGSPSSSNTGQNIRFFTPGTYNVTLTGTYNGASATKTRQITVVDPNDFDPDLVFSSHSLSKNPVVPNDRLTIDWTITNNGATDTRFFFNNYYYSDNNVLDANDHMYDYIASEDDYQVTVNSGASVSGNKEIKIPWDAQAGTRYIIVQLYSEGDEESGNNVLVIPITVEEVEDEEFAYKDFRIRYGGGGLSEVLETNDGFVLATTQQVANNRSRSSMTRIDYHGNVDWFKSQIEPYSVLDRLGFGAMTFANNKIYSGYSVVPHNSSDLGGQYIAIANLDGEITSAKKLPSIGGHQLFLRDINAHGNNIYASFVANNIVYFGKYDFSLNPVWIKKVSNISSLQFIGDEITSAFYAVINGNELSKLSTSTGQVLWRNGIDSELSLDDVHELNGAVYLTATTHKFSDPYSETVIVKLNTTSGQVNWYKSFGNGEFHIYNPLTSSMTKNPYGSGLLVSSRRAIVNISESGNLLNSFSLGGYGYNSLLLSIRSSNSDLFGFINHWYLGISIGSNPASEVLKLNPEFELCSPKENINLTLQNRTTTKNQNTSTFSFINQSLSLISENIFEANDIMPFKATYCGRSCELSASMYIDGSLCVANEIEFRYTGEGAELIEWYHGITKIGEGVILNHLFASSGNKTIRVVASQSNGCVVESEEIVTIQNNPTIIGTAHTSECEDNKGKILISISGNSPYNYYWSNQATTEDIYNLFPDEYNVRVSDANGCSISKDFTVECFDLVSMQFDVPDKMTIGQSYSISYSVKNTGAADFSGILYYRLDNGSLVTVYSGAIASGASKSGSIVISPVASLEGINVSLELLYKAYNLTSYYNVDYGEDAGLKYIDICNGRIEICDGIDNDCDGLVDEGNVCCVDQLTITSATDPLYESSQTITTSGNVDINSGQRSQFRSQAVILKPGFHTKSGSVFRANIDSCNN